MQWPSSSGGEVELKLSQRGALSDSDEYVVPKTDFARSGTSPTPGPVLPRQPPKPPKVCPRCAHEERGDASVCPNDGAGLIDLDDEAIRVRGKICPTCRMGHAAGTALCPNDQTPLVYYALYEAQQKEQSANKNTCPKCGGVYDASVGFCPEDGTRLG